MSVTSDAELRKHLEKIVEERFRPLITDEVLEAVALALSETYVGTVPIQLYLCPKCGSYGIHSPPDCGHW